jgi:hypothetical protein
MSCPPMLPHRFKEALASLMEKVLPVVVARVHALLAPPWDWSGRSALPPASRGAAAAGGGAVAGEFDSAQPEGLGGETGVRWKLVLCEGAWPSPLVTLCLPQSLSISCIPLRGLPERMARWRHMGARPGSEGRSSDRQSLACLPLLVILCPTCCGHSSPHPRCRSHPGGVAGAQRAAACVLRAAPRAGQQRAERRVAARGPSGRAGACDGGAHARGGRARGPRRAAHVRASLRAPRQRLVQRGCRGAACGWAGGVPSSELGACAIASQLPLPSFLTPSARTHALSLSFLFPLTPAPCMPLSC